MQTECSADLFGFTPVEGRKVVTAFDGGQMTSDAGAMLLGATDKQIRLIERFAGCFTDSGDCDFDRAHGGEPGRTAGVRDRIGLRGPDRPRPVAPRPGNGG